MRYGVVESVVDYSELLLPQGDDVMWRLILASSLGLALASGPVLAADMALKSPPPPPAPTSWTGFYLDAGGGYGLWSSDTTTVANPFSVVPPPGTCILCVVQTQGGKGWLGRVGGGFDYQIGRQIVIGALADWDFSSLSGTIQDQGPFFAGTIKENQSWAAGARIGWVIAPQVLTYVNGGYSATHFNSAGFVSTFTGVPATLGGVQFATPAFWKSGWFLGGGVESSLAGFLPGLPSGLFLRTEYRYASYGSTTLTDCAGPVTAATCGNSITFKPSNQTVTTSLVWRFNWSGGPVAARY